MAVQAWRCPINAGSLLPALLVGGSAGSASAFAFVTPIVVEFLRPVGLPLRLGFKEPVGPVGRRGPIQAWVRVLSFFSRAGFFRLSARGQRYRYRSPVHGFLVAVHFSFAVLVSLCYLGAKFRRPSGNAHDAQMVAGSHGGSPMPDAYVLLNSFRDELKTLDSRRAELREQLEVLDREHAQLATTIAVLEDRVGPAPESGALDGRGDVSLADRILDAVGTSGLRRVEMLGIFTRQGFTPSAIDSATNRLVRRGAVQRRGRRIVRVVPPSGPAESGGPDPVVPGLSGAGGLVSGADPMPDNEAVHSGSDDRASADGPADPGSAAAAAHGPVGDDESRPLTHRVRDAIAGGIGTRKELITHFDRRGVLARRVDHALSHLRQKKELARLLPGQLALADTRQ